MVRDPILQLLNSCNSCNSFFRQLLLHTTPVTPSLQLPLQLPQRLPHRGIAEVALFDQDEPGPGPDLGQFLQACGWSDGVIGSADDQDSFSFTGRLAIQGRG